MTSFTSQQTTLQQAASLGSESGVCRDFIPYQRDYTDDYLYPEPRKKPYNMEQGPTVHECAYLIQDYFSDRPDVFVDSGGEVYYDRSDRIRCKVAPDLYVSFGVDAASIFNRDAYLVWEAGKPPDFALEVASKSTHDRDREYKPGLYAFMGVQEYWRFDPSGRYHGYQLAGETLVEGVYRPIEISETPDGVTQGYSQVLDLLLCVRAGRLFFRDAATGLDLAGLKEEREARRAEQAARMAAEAEAEQERAGRMAEREARRAAEAESERLRAELRRLRGQ